MEWEKYPPNDTDRYLAEYILEDIILLSLPYMHCPVPEVLIEINRWSMVLTCSVWGSEILPFSSLTGTQNSQLWFECNGSGFKPMNQDFFILHWLLEPFGYHELNEKSTLSSKKDTETPFPLTIFQLKDKKTFTKQSASWSCSCFFSFAHVLS